MNKIFNYVYLTLLLIFSVYVLLNTFVLSSGYKEAKSIEINNINTSNISSEYTSDSYEDKYTDINIETYRYNDTTIYVGYINSEYNLIKTAFADNTYGKNVTDYTSEIAKDNNAIIAINGDYYGVQEYGYVLRNGVIYRSESKGNQEDLVIYEDGTMEIINENDISLEELKEKGAYNVLSFGPGLIIDGEISVSESDEVGKAMASNPRTAIGVLEDGTIVFVVSDGRTDESEGLSLYELATFLKDEIGCTLAYNLDGGGSSTMYFNGEVVNNPTTSGKIKERKVSDIVYVGY